MRISATETHGDEAHVRAAYAVDEDDALLEGWLSAGGHRPRKLSTQPPPDTDSRSPAAEIGDALADRWYR
jgi:hypothetical protein